MSEPATPPTNQPIGWDDFVEICQASGDGVFVATVQADGRPHLAWVMPGYVDGAIWFATFRRSQKHANLRAAVDSGRPDVALHWLQQPGAIPFCRATVRLVDDPAEVARRWTAGVVPYDLNDFFAGPDDPQLQFVELTPTRASVGSLVGGPKRVWSAG